MEASTVPHRLPIPKFEPDIDKIEQKLHKNGVYPTPKIIRTLRKKEIQKHNRKAKRIATQTPLSECEKQTLAEESHFQIVKREYKVFNKAMKGKTVDNGNVLMVGMPWEKMERVELKELLSKSGEFGGEKMKREELMELSKMFEERKQDDLKWVLDDDIEIEDDWLDSNRERPKPAKKRRGENETIQFLVKRLSAKELNRKDWKFSRMMKQSELPFTEVQLLKIVEGLGSGGHWKQALAVVEWVYDDKERKHWKSRFVYTKLLAVLGRARRPQEALHIFNLMRGDCDIYPDMAAYHSIAVTLGQAGLLKELMYVIECMRQMPSTRTKNMRRKNWDPILAPDLVIYNAVLNACVTSHQWKGVAWVFQQLRQSGLKPNGPTYGLAMEVMLQSGKYDLVHEVFRKMRRSGEAPKALTYKILVSTFWEEGKVDEAVKAVRDMEQRGVVGTACVYYELACCLCKNGRWRDSIMEIEKMKRLRLTKPLEVTFTGMIMSSMDGGHIDDCISIFEFMKDHCTPNIGTINAMLKVYCRNDMFFEARELFEDVRRANSSSTSSLDESKVSLIPDEYTYRSMLEASASALQWEYFEYVYKEMTLVGYRLDQSKNASLLVEASRAGKSYLLEHAVDTILEAGEVPQALIFTEMVFQATAQQNFERAVTLINTMAHAPFQVSQRQWMDLFEENRDRVSWENLENLLDALCSCDVASEATVSNLSKSLHILCRSGASSNISHSVGFDHETSDRTYLDGCNGQNGGNSREIMPNANANMMGGNPKAVVVSREPDHIMNQLSEVEGYGEHLDELSNEFDEADFEIPMNKVGDSPASNLPSAYEILDTWKERRKKDGILFPFQLDRK